VSGTGLAFYVHVPYCAARCGYCDFNTYAPGEDAHRTRRQWREAAVAEVALAASRLGTGRPAASVFFGGGTPTLLPAADLAAVLAAIRDTFGLAPDAEITTEANPETIAPSMLDDLLAAGFTRLSLGMQSADETVLRVLDRRHTPGSAVRAARRASLAGFERVSLDLIYGTPGEDLASWRRTLDAALESGVGHVSAYALKVEPGTALHRRVRTGAVAAPDDDYAAAAYELADEVLGAAGLTWYEISNWAVPGEQCRHNLLYWHGGDWWGIGPGAHSHIAGVRWWNRRNPRAWIAALQDGADPREGEETLTRYEQVLELLMLRLRLRDGLPPAQWAALAPGPAWHKQVRMLRDEGLAMVGDGIVLTRRGRLMADAVTLRLLDCVDEAAPPGELPASRDSAAGVGAE
jgi:oxygen-independent coproporphyrinogen-3 oxidase